MQMHWWYTLWLGASFKCCQVFLFLLIRKYTSQSDVPFKVKVLTFCGWYLGLATIAILPVDISLTANYGGESEEMAEVQYGLRIAWRSFYWLAFLYSFVLAPLTMNFEVSGEFDVQKRIKEALMKEVTKYARYAVLGAVFLVWLWFHGSIAGLTVKGLLIALGSAAGLLQIIIFLGYGLINVPRQLRYMDSQESQLKIALCRVDTCEDRL